MKHKVLLVDDDIDILKTQTLLLEKQYQIFTASTQRDCLDIVKNHDIRAVLLDLYIPGESYAEIIHNVKNTRSNLPIIMFSGHSQINYVVDAIKEGAHGYLTKGCNTQEIINTLDAAISSTITYQDFETVKQTDPDIYIGKNKHMLNLFKQAKDIAPASSINILVRGETGAGKDVLAQYIHNHSERREGPFIAINCGAIPESLIESELFGHEEGAFTDAKLRKGKLEQAHTGTLFLDEIGTMKAEMQVRLLRVIQDKKLERIGASHALPIDIRIIAATNSDIEEQIQNNSFRQDLYYRLSGVEFTIPPLRDRQNDFESLFMFLLNKHSSKLNSGSKQVSKELINILKLGKWMGNVRELSQLTELLAFLMKEQEIITLNNLPKEWLPRLFSEYTKIKEIPIDERRKILKQLLGAFENNITHLANFLNIDRSTIYRTLEESSES